MVKRIFWFLFVVVAGVASAAVYIAQDANRFKPEIEALIAENSAFEVSIDGDLAWQLWPPVTLHVENVVARNDTQTINAASLDLKADLSAIWQDVDAWRVTSLALADVVIEDEGTTTQIHDLELRDFRPGEPAEFDVDLTQTPDVGAPLDLTASGILTYYAETTDKPQRVTFADTAFTSNFADGTCWGEAVERLNAPTDLPAATELDVLPLATLLAYNGAVNCKLSRLELGTETFADAEVDTTLLEGLVNVHLDVRDFLGGTMVLDTDIDATNTPVRWDILPDLEGVDSQRLIDWTNRSYIWAAPLALESSVTMTGNTQADLLASISAQSEFDGGQGVLDVTKLKKQLQRIAILTNRSDKVANWPDMLRYETMTGTLAVDGKRHALEFVLDNLHLTADGEIDYMTDTADLVAYVTVNEAPEGSPLTVNDWLQGTPIPMRCRGTANDPKCRIDNDATKQIVARALQRGDETGLRQKLEDKIDEKVPEEYKEAAKGVLDLIGRALERD